MTLIEGGYGSQSTSDRRRAQARRARGRRTARAAAPLLIPLALALTLGVILAVSSVTTPTAHVNQTSTTRSAHP